MRDELIALLEKHSGTLRSEATKIETYLQNFGPDADNDQIQTTIYLVHKIKGSSGALGFLPLSKSANTLEYALRDLNDRQDRDLGIAEIHQLSAAFQQEIRDLDPEASTLFQSEIMAQR